MKNTSENARRYAAFTAISLFALLILYLLRDFITPFLGALTFYVLLKPVMYFLTGNWKWKKIPAALMICLLSFVIILIPVLSFSYLMYYKLHALIQNPEPVYTVVHLLSGWLKEYAGIELFSTEFVQLIQTRLASVIPTILGKGAYVIGNIAVMYFVLYYMLTNIETINTEVQRTLPFEPDNIRKLSDTLNQMTISNAVGVPLVGVIQGAIAGIGYWIFGLPDPLFWAVLTALVSFLPVIGTTLIWIPASLYLFATTGNWQGPGLFIYGVAVVVNIDNIIRFMLQKRFADVHPMITVFGVIIGLNLFGLPGLIFGPLMLSYFVLFVTMYRNSVTKDEQSS